MPLRQESWIQNGLAIGRKRLNKAPLTAPS
jgi:hypothetical protein